MANKFSIGGIKIFSTAGTIFASLVGAPLLIYMTVNSKKKILI
ncbi:hypothetical protein [Prevotella veroralis]|uniref:Uncharacterized protein n=1 Tax=Prevotella veroralis F0319 TaxID=649761 RepID=C9MQA2_9BACT|nr:hypothetical protein [Prevotella veroralis]EEX18306.1 hypothetical protein HMPREF0973_01802 [Prevotella veroralis F0319]